MYRRSCGEMEVMMAGIGILNITLNELRSLVIEVLKKYPQTQYLTICSNVAHLAVEKGMVTNPYNSPVFGGSFDLGSRDQDLVREVIWDLIIERVLTIGMNSSNPAWPWLSLTSYGKKVVVESELPIPHDPSGYIGRIKAEITNLDPVILVYLEESLNTYNINALLSSTIALGCASEKALLLLIEAYTKSIQDEDNKDRFLKRTNGKFIKTQFEEFSKSLRGVIGVLPSDIRDGLDTVLLGVFEMIRNNRNDVGHPTGKAISKEQLFANIQVFIPYCKKIYKLIDYFDSNPINKT